MFWLAVLIHLTGAPDADYLSAVIDPTHYDNAADCNHVLKAYVQALTDTSKGLATCLAVDGDKSIEIPFGGKEKQS